MLSISSPYFRGSKDEFLITNDPEVQSQVERHSEFGKFIFALVMDLTCTPAEDDDEDE
jgi:hypothetical protein